MKLVAGQQKKQIKDKIDEIEINFSGVDVPVGYGIISADQYDPGYCEVLIAAMRCGLDRKGAAGAIGVSFETFEKWEAEYPQFAEAAKVGDSLHNLFWQQQGIKGLVFSPTGKQLNSKVYGLNMAARFGWGNAKEEDKKQLRVLAFELGQKPQYDKE